MFYRTALPAARYVLSFWLELRLHLSCWQLVAWRAHLRSGREMVFFCTALPAGRCALSLWLELRLHLNGWSLAVWCAHLRSGW